MPNISSAVIDWQRRVVEKFCTRLVALQQIRAVSSHAESLNAFMNSTDLETVLFLDIDCVPLQQDAIEKLLQIADAGVLAGCAQRANHINNNQHIYVGPFCMALSKRLWQRLGRPSFAATRRGDVGEELTYRCEASGAPIHLLWPSDVGSRRWDLDDGRHFGPQTTYEDAFFHAFEIRHRVNQDGFVRKCASIVGQIDR